MPRENPLTAYSPPPAMTFPPLRSLPVHIERCRPSPQQTPSRYLLRSHLEHALHLPPPEGFRHSIRAADEYLAAYEASADILGRRSMALGQAFSYAVERLHDDPNGAASVQLAERAVDSARQACEIDVRWRQVIQHMYRSSGSDGDWRAFRRFKMSRAGQVVARFLLTLRIS